jgi:hypothetical protein
MMAVRLNMIDAPCRVGKMGLDAVGRSWLQASAKTAPLRWRLPQLYLKSTSFTESTEIIVMFQGVFQCEN